METISVETNGNGRVASVAMPRRDSADEIRNIVRTAIDLAGGPKKCAHAMGVTRSALSKWELKEERERGFFKNVAYRYVMALADASGIPPWRLTGIPPFRPGGIEKEPEQPRKGK